MDKLKKRLNGYIEKYSKKGYTIEQIKKALIIYGFEPKYVDDIIAEYKSRHATRLILLFVVLALPLVLKPAITGYYFLNWHINFLNPYTAFLVLIVLTLLVSILGFKKLRIDKVDIKFAIGKISMQLRGLISGFKFPTVKTESKQEYKETNPLISLYVFLIVAASLIALVSVFFKNFKLMVFSIISAGLAFIGYRKVIKMYYKEEGIR